MNVVQVKPVCNSAGKMILSPETEQALGEMGMV
jgi:hypothetical protein